MPIFQEIAMKNPPCIQSLASGSGTTLLFAIILCFLFLLPASEIIAGNKQKETIRIGILAKRGKQECSQKWGPTIAYLNGAVPGYRFLLVRLNFDELPGAVVDNKLHFVLCNPAMYVRLEHLYGATRIATLHNKRLNKAITRFGGVIFTRADRKDITSTNDLIGKTFMAVNPESFGGWLVAKRYLLNHGLRPEKDFTSLSFGNTHDSVVYQVKNGTVDAGTVRTDVLERMTKEGKINLREFKVLDPQPPDDTGFPFLRTTRLYPEWPFAKTKKADDQLARKVAIALLSMSADDNAAITADIMGWTIPLDYTPVHACLKFLHFSPYDQVEKITWRRMISQYRLWLMAMAGFVLLLIGSATHVFFLNRRLHTAMGELDRKLIERKEIIADLNEFKHALDQINDSVFMFNPDTLNFEYVNQGALSRIGYSYGELFAMTPVDIKPEFDEQQFRKMIDPLIQSREDSLTFTTIHRRKDGSTLPVEVFLQYVHQESGQGVFVAIVHDISSRLAEEKEKEQLQARLLHTQKLESVGRLAAGIAHEINTPVQYVGTNIDFLDESFSDIFRLVKRFLTLLTKARKIHIDESLLNAIDEELEEIDWEYLADEIPQAISQSKEGVRRVTSIVLAMKEFSHPGSKDKVPIDLNRLIETTITIARNEWKYVSEVKTDLAENLPQVPCLSDEMGQVLLNLLVNAAHAIADTLDKEDAESKGTITIATRLIDNMAEIKIRDNGAGIPQEIREHIFEPFFTTKEVGKGTGQGLAIARDVIVNKHGGTIEVSSTEGNGTTFIIHLPLTEDMQP